MKKSWESFWECAEILNLPYISQQMAGYPSIWTLAENSASHQMKLFLFSQEFLLIYSTKIYNPMALNHRAVAEMGVSLGGCFSSKTLCWWIPHGGTRQLGCWALWTEGLFTVRGWCPQTDGEPSRPRLLFTLCSLWQFLTWSRWVDGRLTRLEELG